MSETTTVDKSEEWAKFYAEVWDKDLSGPKLEEALERHGLPKDDKMIKDLTDAREAVAKSQRLDCFTLVACC